MFDWKELEQSLPPLVSRPLAEKVGPLKQGHLRALDCRGEGPPERVKIGSRVFYPRESLIEFFKCRSEVFCTPERAEEILNTEKGNAR